MREGDHAISSRSWTRWLVAVLVASLTALLLPASLSTVAAVAQESGDSTADAAPDRSLSEQAPLPGEVLLDLSDGVRIGARATSSAAIQSVTLYVDGHATQADVQQLDAHNWDVYALLDDLAAGEHVAVLELQDGTDATWSQMWRFAVGGLRVNRIAGADRIETAVAASRATFRRDGVVSGAVLARSDGFADALAGGTLARAVRGPLLLTQTDGLPDPVRDELGRVLAPDAVVYVLGGPQAVGADVVAAVEAQGYSVVRLFGEDRVATAVAVADRVQQLSATPPTGAVLASGSGFADALSAAAPAARDGWPVLLTDPDVLAEEVVAHLQEGGYDQVVVVGGNVALTEAVETRVRELVPDVVRLGGSDRYATSAAVAIHFYPASQAVGVASGRTFPDALAGSVHAAAHGLPLLLTDPDRLPPATARRVGAFAPEAAIVYGGVGAIDRAVEGELRRAAVGGDGPYPIALRPAQGSEVDHLTHIEVDVHRLAELGKSSIVVTVDGRRASGRLTFGASGRTLVFHLDRLPVTPVVGEAHAVRVVAMAGDERGRSYLDAQLVLRPTVQFAGSGAVDVLALQHRLMQLGYWLGEPDGQYGRLTRQAVMAFEKVHGLPRDGEVDAEVRQLLDVTGRPVPQVSRGRLFEVDKPRQVIRIVEHGLVRWTLNTSTGTEDYYYYEGRRYLAHTPVGDFQVERQIDGLRVSHLGELWRPKYFVGGIAVHGSPSVPAYPASHGCVRLTNAAMDWIWASGQMPIGTRVVVTS